MAQLAANAAFLSVRLPDETRDRLKAAAASRGETVQGLVGGLVTQFLDGRQQGAPELGRVMAVLRAHRDMLRARGVTGLWVFGSTARGAARADSDIDLFAECAADAKLGWSGSPQSDPS